MKTPFLSQVLALLIAAALPSVASFAAESPSLLLQKGIYAEEIERNLDSAIKIYEQIATEAAASRNVVAQAQYRLAVCYQKKGNKEQAIKLLNELVQQAPGDPIVGKKAREILGELGMNPAATPSARKIPLPLPTTWLMSMSADGRFVAYQPKGSYDVAVSDVVTGKTSFVVRGSKEKQLWAPAKFSRDGHWLAYHLSGDSLSMAKSDGSETRTVYEDKNGCWFADWWPDSSHIILWATPVAEKSSTIGVVYSLDLSTGAKREFGRVRHGGTLEIAPDGASAVRVVDRAYPRRIELWNFKTAKEEILVNRDTGDFYGWFANGTKILYSKRRLEGIELLAVGVKDGRLQGEPEHIWTIAGEAWPMGIGDDGTVYYQAPTETSAAINMVNYDLWAIDGLLSRRVPVASLFAEIPPDELLGPDNTIQDRKYGLTFKLPKDWSVGYTRQRDRTQRGIGLNVPGRPQGSVVNVWYARNNHNQGAPWTPAGEPPTTDGEIDRWLREGARLKAVQRIEQENLGDFSNRPESFASRTLGGHRALSWSADFTRGGQKWAEYHALVRGKEIGADFWMRCPVEDFETIRIPFQSMIETVRLP